MKSKNRAIDIALHIATGLVIITSIVLWIFILTSDQRFSGLNQSTDTDTTHVKNSKSIKDAYLPTEVFGYRNNQLYQLYDYDKNLPLVFSKEFNNAKIERIKPIFITKKDYQKFLANKAYLQLTYPDQITFGIFSSNVSKYKNSEFNRIFIAQKDGKFKLYAGNDLNHRIYEVSLKNGNFDKLLKYAQKSESKTAVSLIRLSEGYEVSYKNDLTVNVYSYLISNPSDSYFVSRLLGTSGVSSKTAGNVTTYTAGLYNHLEVPKSNSKDYHNYTYINYQKSSIPNPNTRLSDSVTYVHKLGLVEQDLRFFDAEGSSVVYTNYIEGYPVFIKTQGPQIQIRYSTDNITIKFNSTNLQIPVPFDGRTVKIPKTSTVIKTLQAKGIAKSDIQRMTIGFELVRDSAHDSLVDLTPTYYIKIYNHWLSLSEWQNANLAKYRTSTTSSAKGLNVTREE